MKLRNIVAISVLILLGAASTGAVLGLYREVSVRASAPDFAQGLSNIPAGYQLVFGMNVRKFAQSSAYDKFRQNSPAGNDLAVFIEKTGLDPMRDVTYLVGAGSGKAGDRGLVIVSGAFNKDAIMSYIRSKSDPIEHAYAGATVVMIPEPKSDTVQKGVAFINSREIALGDLESLKEALDIRGRESLSILHNETIAPLIRSIGPDEMFWFAGDASGLISRAPNSPFTTSLTASTSNLKSIVGSMNFGETLTGKITATAFDADQALKLADAMRGLIALGQLVGDRNPDLKAFLGGLAVSQVSEQVRLDLNISAELLAKMGRTSKIQQ